MDYNLNLRARLRWTASTMELLSDENLMLDAADRIEELEAALREIRDEAAYGYFGDLEQAEGIARRALGDNHE